MFGRRILSLCPHAPRRWWAEVRLPVVPEGQLPLRPQVRACPRAAWSAHEHGAARTSALPSMGSLSRRPPQHAMAAGAKWRVSRICRRLDKPRATRPDRLRRSFRRRNLRGLMALSRHCRLGRVWRDRCHRSCQCKDPIATLRSHRATTICPSGCPRTAPGGPTSGVASADRAGFEGGALASAAVPDASMSTSFTGSTSFQRPGSLSQSLSASLSAPQPLVAWIRRLQLRRLERLPRLRACLARVRSATWRALALLQRQPGLGGWCRAVCAFQPRHVRRAQYGSYGRRCEFVERHARCVVAVDRARRARRGRDRGCRGLFAVESVRSANAGGAGAATTQPRSVELVCGQGRARDGGAEHAVARRRLRVVAWLWPVGNRAERAKASNIATGFQQQKQGGGGLDAYAFREGAVCRARPAGRRHHAPGQSLPQGLAAGLSRMHLRTGGSSDTGLGSGVFGSVEGPKGQPLHRHSRRAPSLHFAYRAVWTSLPWAQQHPHRCCHTVVRWALRWVVGQQAG